MNTLHQKKNIPGSMKFILLKVIRPFWHCCCTICNKLLIKATLQAHSQDSLVQDLHCIHTADKRDPYQTFSWQPECDKSIFFQIQSRPVLTCATQWWAQFPQRTNRQTNLPISA